MSSHTWGKESRRRAAELLETFELTEAADRRISRYSGGMRRRLDFATALSNRPRVLFLDEPTTGLDPQSRMAVWAMVKEARDSGTAVFLTTQYLEEAERLADTVAIIDGGRVVASGTVSELTSSFGRVTVRFRVADEDVTAVKAGAHGYETQFEDGCVQIHLHGAEGKGDAVLTLLQRLHGRDPDDGSRHLTGVPRGRLRAADRHEEPGRGRRRP
ncbi:MAG: type transport system ATP-binding protein [Actinomycetota bacterium]|nr:type transport system ATP-binding protein [Actinomycetota bacterium]